MGYYNDLTIRALDAHSPDDDHYDRLDRQDDIRIACLPQVYCPMCGAARPLSPFGQSCWCDTCRPKANAAWVWVDQVQPGQWFVVLWSTEGTRWEMGRGERTPVARREGTGHFELVPVQWQVVVVEAP